MCDLRPGVQGADNSYLELLLPGLYKQINDLKKRLECVKIALKADVSEIILNGDLLSGCDSAGGFWLLEVRLDFVNCDRYKQSAQ
jgi:hypothetical protein